ncbi:MAG: hypothetical protein VCA74_03825 [Deltaproteobacteria bacterium]
MRDLRRFLCPAVVVAAAALALRRLDDFDTWWHLAAGRWIFNNREVPLTDTLSYSVPANAWTDVQWLYDLALYGLYQAGGAGALVLATTVILTAAVALMLRNMRMFAGPVLSALVGIWVVLVAEERFLIRPESVSLLLLQVLLYVLLSAAHGHGKRLWLLPPLMVLWANTHALFIIGVFLVGAVTAVTAVGQLMAAAAWAVPSVLKPFQPPAARQMLVIGPLSVVATLCNPYLSDGVLFPLGLLSRIDGSQAVFRAIGEFRPPFSDFFPTSALMAYQTLFVLAVAVVAWAFLLRLLRRRSPQDLGLAGLVIFAGLAWLSLLARRNIAIFAMGTAPFIVSALAFTGTGLFAAGRVRGRVTQALSAVFLASVVLFVAAVATNQWYRLSGTTHEFGLGVLEENFPSRAVAFTRETGLPGPLYNDLSSGGYLSWDSPVPGGVFIDGRLEVYGAEFFSSYRSALSNPRKWQLQSAKYAVNTVIMFHRWGDRQPIVRWLFDNPAWSLVYHDEVAVVFVRSQGNADVIRRARMEFPLWYDGNRRRLLGATPVLVWPLGRVAGLIAYGNLLFNLGEDHAGAEMYARAADLGPKAHIESKLRYRIARHLARRGETAAARLGLGLALGLDPGNSRAREMLERLGQ